MRNIHQSNIERRNKRDTHDGQTVELDVEHIIDCVNDTVHKSNDGVCHLSYKASDGVIVQRPCRIRQGQTRRQYRKTKANTRTAQAQQDTENDQCAAENTCNDRYDFLNGINHKIPIQSSNRTKAQCPSRHQAKAERKGDSAQSKDSADRQESAADNGSNHADFLLNIIGEVVPVRHNRRTHCDRTRRQQSQTQGNICPGERQCRTDSEERHRYDRGNNGDYISDFIAQAIPVESHYRNQRSSANRHQRNTEGHTPGESKDSAECQGCPADQQSYSGQGRSQSVRDAVPIQSCGRYKRDSTNSHQRNTQPGCDPGKGQHSAYCQRSTRQNSR